MTNEELALFFAGLSAIASAGAAVYAGVQLRRSRLEPQRRATLEQIVKAEDRAHALGSIDAAEIHETILRCYRGECEMTEESSAYLRFLNTLDVAAFLIR